MYSAIFQRITDEELEFVTEASAGDVPPIFGEYAINACLLPLCSFLSKLTPAVQNHAV